MPENQNHAQSLLGVFFAILAAVGLSSFIPWGAGARPNGLEHVKGAASPSAGYSPGDDAATRPSDERVLGPLLKFLDLGHAPPAAGDLSAELLRRLDDAVRTSAPGGRGWSLQFMIATVPDPVDSAQGEWIDLLLDTFQNALRLDRFVLDRYYLPWQSYRESARKAAGPGDGGPERRYVGEPGLLLFREADEKRLTPDAGHAPPRLLLVFLVGETPVSGIHKEAFARSVGLVREIGVDREDPSIPVLAPYFSGSADSLALAVRSALSDASRADGAPVPDVAEKAIARNGALIRTDGPPVFDVVSGTATSVDPARLEIGGIKNAVDFAATVIPDEYVKRELIEYVWSKNPGGARIAWLSESNTGYGDYGGGREKDRGEDDRPTIVEYPFPLHISRLRSIHEFRRGDDQALGLPSTPEQTRVGIPLDILETARDTPAPFAPGLTNAYVESMLAQIFRSIREQGVHYVGITATDARDVAFLANSLREYSPDTQLLTTDSDQIYLRPDLQADLRGALVGSTYPLFPKLQDWTSRPPREAAAAASPRRNFLTFASGSHQGFYNAALALRRNAKSRVLMKTRDEDERARLALEISNLELLDYGIPFEFEPSAPRRPPVWISVVGDESFWPLKYTALASKSPRLMYEPKDAAPPGGEARPATEFLAGSFSFPYDRASLAVVLGLILFGLINVVFYFLGLDWGPASYFDRARLQGPDQGPDGADPNPAGQGRESAESLVKLYLVGCVLPLWILLSALGLLAFIPLLAEPRFEGPAFFQRPSGDSGIADLSLSVSCYLSVGYLACNALALWILWYLLDHDARLAKAMEDLDKDEASHEEDRKLIRRQRAQNELNVKGLRRIDAFVRVAFAAVFVGFLVAETKSARLARFGPGDWSILKYPLSLGLILGSLLAIERLRARVVGTRNPEPPRRRLTGWVEDRIARAPLAACVAPLILMFIPTFLYARLAPPVWIGNLVVFSLATVVAGGLLTILYEALVPGEWRSPNRPNRWSFWAFQAFGVLGQALLLFVGAVVWLCFRDDDPAHFLGHLVLLFERSTHLYGGVSLLTLMIFLSLAVYAWGFTQLRRSYLFHYYYPHFTSADAPGTEPAREPTQWRNAERDDIRETRKRLDALVENPTPTIMRRASVWYVLALLIAGAWMGRLRVNAVPPFEHGLLSLLAWVGLYVFLLLWVHWLTHLVLLMNQVSKLLYQIALLPMQSAFSRLPRPVDRLLGRLLYASRPRFSLCRIPVHYLERIVATYPEPADPADLGPGTVFQSNWRGAMATTRRTSEELSEKFTKLSGLYPDMTQGILVGADHLKRATAFITIQTELAKATWSLWDGLIAEWSRREPRQAYPPREGPPPADPGRAPEDRARAERWVGLVEEFMAIQIAIYLSQLVYQGRNLLYGLLAGSLLILLAVLSYPLQPHRLLVSSCMTMVLIVAIVGVAIFVRMERDPLVSRITGKGSEGVQFDFRFFVQISPFVIPAAFILVAGLFPDFGRWLATLLGSWSG